MGVATVMVATMVIIVGIVVTVVADVVTAGVIAMVPGVGVLTGRRVPVGTRSVVGVVGSRSPS